MPLASSSAVPALDGPDVGGFEDQAPLEGDLLAGPAVADADGPDGHVMVADQGGDVAGEPRRVDAGADELLVAVPHKAAMPCSPQTVTPCS